MRSVACVLLSIMGDYHYHVDLNYSKLLPFGLALPMHQSSAK